MKQWSPAQNSGTIDLPHSPSTPSNYPQRVRDFRRQIDVVYTSEKLFSHAQKFILAERDIYGTFQDKQVDNLMGDLDALFLLFPQNYLNPTRLKILLSILLQQQVEVRWYEEFPRYVDEDDLKRDRQLYDLTTRPCGYHLNFSFIALCETGIHRLLSPLKRRIRVWQNHPAGGTVGMKTVQCKPSTIGLLNQISEDVGKVCGRSVSLQINSIIRTRQHQKHLASLGYWAPQTSTHSTGYAVDIEQAWYAKNDRLLFSGIQVVLEDYFRRSILNVIDEERVWHICLNPKFIEFYENRASLWKV